MKPASFVLVVVSLALMLTGCRGGETPTTVAPPPSPPTNTSPPPATSTPTPVPPTFTPTLSPLSPSNLPADPQRVEFQNADGLTLVGYYYPSRYAHAPVIVLMHWARGDKRDWCKIAPWLQNRSDESPAEMPGCSQVTAAAAYARWWDDSWFPPLPDETSYAVFAFDFAGAGESEGPQYGATPQDVLAALQTVATLEGVDASRILAAGASFGADGGPDGCLLYQQAGGKCLGAFSWSPGSFLGMRYASVIADLTAFEPPVLVWCLAAENEAHDRSTCESASDHLARTFVFAGTDAHGMDLITPELTVGEPAKNSLELFLDFLAETLGE